MVIQQGVLGYTFYVIDVYKSHAHEKKVSFLLLNRFFILPLQKNLHFSAKIYRYGKIYKPIYRRRFQDNLRSGH